MVHSPGFSGGAGGALGGAGGALGGVGGALGGVTPPGAPGGGGAPAPEAETPGGGGALGSSAPQLLHTVASVRFTVPHFGHLFSFFAAVGGRKHITYFPFLSKIPFINSALLKYREKEIVHYFHGRVGCRRAGSAAIRLHSWHNPNRLRAEGTRL